MLSRPSVCQRATGSRVGIADVGLEVYAGEVLGYLGPNGAGKTTTIRILLDLIRADAGRAEIFGFNVRKRSLDVRRRCRFSSPAN